MRQMSLPGLWTAAALAALAGLVTAGSLRQTVAGRIVAKTRQIY